MKKNYFKTFLIFVTILSCGMTNAMADSFSEMRFTNRARCALDSKQPTDSAYLLINNMDIARSVYRLGKSRGEDTSKLTKMGIQVYRYSITELLNHIHKKLANRELPLLPADTTAENVPNRYKQIMETCKSDALCPELDQYLSQVWSAAHTSNPVDNAQKIDNFDTDSNLLSSKVFNNRVVENKLKCSYLRKFSPLEAELFGTKPTKELLNQLGNAANKVDDYLADCSDYTKQESVKVASFELSIKNIDTNEWNKFGFDYWNSLKIYFSWAFRNAPEMKQFGFPFQGLFSAVAIEDSVIIVPNGCKSITPPKCESDYLNQNAIREFSRNDFKKEAANLDMMTSIPEGAQLQMLKDPFTEVNKDILGLGKFDTSDEWAENFRDNFSGTRTLMRKNLLKSVSNLDIISKKLNSEKMINKLSDYFLPLFSNNNVDAQIDLKNQLYYLCAEYTFASNEEISFIKGKLDLLKKVTLLDGVISTVVDNSSADYFNYFEAISKKVNQLCSSFDQNKMFNNTFTLEKSGFSPWYIERVYENKVTSMQDILNQNYLSTNVPLLSYASFQNTKKSNDVICTNAPDCARKVLKSILDLYAATQYADTFWSLDNKVKSPDLFNPYAERTACKVYDPWFKTKTTLFSAFTDVLQGALATVAPGAVFGTFDLAPGRAVSFNQLVSEGKIKYDTKYSKSKVQASLAMDFGNLLGVPCGVSVSKTNDINPYDVLQFNGISVRSCTKNDTNVVTVNSASDIGTNENKKLSGCVVCALNFEQVSSSVTKFVPGGQAGFFLIRALVRLYRGFKDPLNIPRSWSVQPELVRMSFNAFKGNIPDSCVRTLSNSKACMPNSCEAEIATLMFNKTNAKVTNIDSSKVDKGYAMVTVENCKNPIKLRASYIPKNSDDFSSNDFTCNPRIKELPENCNILK
jgi:hypothetical protein